MFAFRMFAARQDESGGKVEASTENTGDGQSDGETKTDAERYKQCPYTRPSWRTLYIQNPSWDYKDKDVSRLRGFTKYRG